MLRSLRQKSSRITHVTAFKNSNYVILKKVSRLLSSYSNNSCFLISHEASHDRQWISSSRRFSSSINHELDIMDDKKLLKFNTLHEMTRNASIAFANNDLFGTYNTDRFEWMSYGEFGNLVGKTRTILKDMGVEEYSKIGIIANNRWEWAVIAAASYSLNATLVPMYEAQHPSDWSYILNDSSATCVFCATQDIYDQVANEVFPVVPSLQFTCCLNAPLGEPHAFSTALATADFAELTPVILPTPDDLANLVYTSGTTGRPKGVELTHSNAVSNILGVRESVPDPKKFVGPKDRSLSFLPWAHSYGQTCELWCLMSQGASIGVCRGVPNILEDLQLVKPTVLFSVPTLYKKVYDGVHGIMETGSPLRRRLMERALEFGRRRNSLGVWEGLQFKFLDSVVLEKIRQRFGGRLRLGFSAGAACPKDIVEFMDDVGIPVCEGYGLTETSPIITLNVPGNRKSGSVGPPLSGVNVVVVGEDGEFLGREEVGEICCYGPNVMRGYHGNEKATEEVITTAPDGKSRLFHTGDLGKLSSDGFVYIIGRIKENFKLENGKYVCPAPIEESISMSRFILQAVICGANRPHNVVLLVPDWEAIRAELKLTNDLSSQDELANDLRVRVLIDEEIKEHCRRFKKYEIPKSWAFVAPFTAANDMLTPKMSIRRHKVMKAYGDVITEMYGDNIVSCSADGGSHHEEKAA